MKKVIFTIALCSTLIFAETIITKGSRESSQLDYMQFNDIEDTIKLLQDPTPFAKQIEPMSREEQLSYDAKYNIKYFEPWHIESMGLSKMERTWQFMYVKKKMYRVDGTPIPKSWFQKEIKNSNFKDYEKLNIPAITIRHSNLKLFPTDKEFYFDITRTGEGFPFDYNQNSAIYINTPIFVSHLSKDKKWAYVKASFAFGWIKVDDIAYITPKFQLDFERGKYAIATTDNLSLLDDGNFISIVKLGSIFPMADEKDRYIVAFKDKKGYAYIKKFRPTDINLVVKKPIKFNQFNVAFIAKQLVNEPYGWGGKLQARDCSALTRDFLAPFGIFLPRNSSQQAKSSDGEYISLKGLSKYEKKELIKEYGRPCHSLLFVPGHITLYLGQKDGEPIIMHNYWGVRLNDNTKYITARAIITTTEPGKELENVKEKAKLINTFQGLINF